MKWNIGEPGGPSGPFYSIVSDTGRIIALQISDREMAEKISKLGPIIDYDFDTIQAASKRLRILFEDDKFKVADGVNNYIIRQVIHALFGD